MINCNRSPSNILTRLKELKETKSACRNLEQVLYNRINMITNSEMKRLQTETNTSKKNKEKAMKIQRDRAFKSLVKSVIILI